jgi:nicotinate-nucleotide pyrophosphorylase (carboxylating)
MKLLKSQYEHIVDLAIAEDLGWGDITTESLIPDTQFGTATIIGKGTGVVAGTDVAKHVFNRVDTDLKVDILTYDGLKVKAGDMIAKIEGKISSILKAERTVLNFLQHLSGIATETARYVEAIKGLNTEIGDTRKTVPGLRYLEKYAVRMGGGKTYRMHLGDGILIKDNHLAALKGQGLSIGEIIAMASQRNTSSSKIEIEVTSPQEASEAAEAGADIIMLDNMNLNEMRQSVQLIRGRAIVEASGGINLENIRSVAETGVNLISIGALTHSAKSLDISLQLD